MTNKNPFEVRLDIMKMAQEMLENEQAAKEQKYLQKLEALKAAKHTETEIVSFIDTNAPNRYTPEDVLTRSSTLYNFVANSNSNK